MAGKFGTKRWNRNASPPASRTRNRETLQKPNGVISPRVKAVGGDKFAIVCVDPAKQRSEWMMADYFGNLLIERQTLEHKAAHFKLAITRIRAALDQHGIQDTIVVVERTAVTIWLQTGLCPGGLKHARSSLRHQAVPPVIDPGNKTDENDSMPSTGQQSLDWGCARSNWSHPIGSCSSAYAIAAILSKRHPRLLARFVNTCT
jgi:hypothetical protein